MPNDTVRRCDWLLGARTLPAHSVDLLYADPPFNTGARKRTPPRAARAGRLATQLFDVLHAKRPFDVGEASAGQR